MVGFADTDEVIGSSPAANDNNPGRPPSPNDTDGGTPPVSPRQGQQAGTPPDTPAGGSSPGGNDDTSPAATPNPLNGSIDAGGTPPDSPGGMSPTDSLAKKTGGGVSPTLGPRPSTPSGSPTRPHEQTGHGQGQGQRPPTPPPNQGAQGTQGTNRPNQTTTTPAGQIASTGQAQTQPQADPTKKRRSKSGQTAKSNTAKPSEGGGSFSDKSKNFRQTMVCHPQRFQTLISILMM